MVLQSGLSESRSEILVKFWNVMLEKEGEDQLARTCLRSTARSQGANNFPTHNKTKEGELD
jgi:hypothetical protein